MNPIQDIPKLWTQDKVHLTIWIATAFLALLSWHVLGVFLPAQSTQEKTILILARALGGMTSVSLGLVLSLIRVSRNKPVTTAYKEIKSKKDISETALSILKFYGDRGELNLPALFFFERFSLTVNQAQRAIDELTAFDLLDSDTPFNEPTVYWLSTKGREFLDKNKML